VLPHVADQSTPSELTSLATVALTVACVSEIILDEGVCVIETAGGCAVMVVYATAGLAAVVADEEARMVTTAPEGIADGAV
jgi:hypothetical protein